jgi:hypothetical protein
VRGPEWPVAASAERTGFGEPPSRKWRRCGPGWSLIDHIHSVDLLTETWSDVSKLIVRFDHFICPLFNSLDPV